ncbi:hypothetical protein C8R45DRAFT_944615 [Mycena sanguinolenta]|nr:hypothetical protein C8R45DRAFT_944615 [Mycena sanguinolenta]
MYLTLKTSASADTVAQKMVEISVAEFRASNTNKEQETIIRINPPSTRHGLEIQPTHMQYRPDGRILVFLDGHEFAPSSDKQRLALAGSCIMPKAGLRLSIDLGLLPCKPLPSPVHTTRTRETDLIPRPHQAQGRGAILKSGSRAIAENNADLAQRRVDLAWIWIWVWWGADGWMLVVNLNLNLDLNIDIPVAGAKFNVLRPDNTCVVAEAPGL